MSKISESTQKYLDIAGIKEGTAVMKDGTLRAMIMVSSINFALKSEDEQNAIVAAYVSFLNNISFPLQIVIQSRELNIENYLTDLRQREKSQVNELLKMHTAEYINYIEELINLGKIMTKRFYVVVPYNPVSDSRKNFFARLSEAINPANVVQMKRERFLELRHELSRRVDSVIGGLASVGLNAVEMDTQSIVDLFYSTYNPNTSANEKLVATGKLNLNQ